MNECRKKNINIELFHGLKWQILLSGAGADVGAALFCLETEPTQFGRSRSRLRDLGLPEPVPEPPKTVAAPQHW